MGLIFQAREACVKPLSSCMYVPTIYICLFDLCVTFIGEGGWEEFQVHVR